MAIVADVIDLGKAGADPSSTTIAFTTTSAVAAGGFILVSVGWFDATATLSSVSGGGLTWTIDKQGKPGAPTSDASALVSAQAPAGLASGTTITATYSVGVVARTIGGSSFTGVATSSPVDTTNGPIGVTPAAAGWTTGSTAISAGSLLYATSYNETGNFTNTVTSPSIQAVLMPNSASPTSQVSCYRIESSAGSYTVAGTWSGNAQSGTIAVAYKAAAAGATVAAPVVPPLLRMLLQGGLQRAKALMLLHPPQVASALVTVSDTRAIVYDLTATQSATRAVKYDLLEDNSATRAVRYDLLGSVNSTRAIKYDLTGTTSATRAIKYDLTATVSATRGVRYDLQQVVSGTRAVRYDLFELNSDTRAVKYDLLGSVSASRGIRYDVVGTTTSTRDVRYDIAITSQPGRTTMTWVGI